MKAPMRGFALLASLLFLLGGGAGCQSTYITPAGGVQPGSLAEGDIAERMQRQPAASFPARVAVARVQQSGYYSYGANSYGEGRYSVVTTREFERDEDFEQLGKLPMIANVASLNRILLPARLESDKELRLAAAALKCDLLLVYSMDTQFRVDDHDVGPLGLITLGFLPASEAQVTSTASAALFDVRTGYVYGVAEATAREKQIANAWNSRDAVEDSRKRSEAAAFGGLVEEFERTWKAVVEQYAGGPAVTRT